ALDAHLLGVHGLVGFEIIEGPAGAPRPGAQCAPIVHLAGLALVAQADDALSQTGAVVGLNAVWDDNGIAPALGQDLLLPGRPAGAAGFGHGRASTGPAAESAEAEFHHDRDWPFRLGRRGQR